MVKGDQSGGNGVRGTSGGRRAGEKNSEENVPVGRRWRMAGARKLLLRGSTWTEEQNHEGVWRVDSSGERRRWQRVL